MRFAKLRSAILVLAVPTAGGAAATSPDLAAPLAAIRNVGPEGRGNAEAAQAWPVLARGTAADLTSLLEAMDGANPLAKNWLRAAVDTVAAREIAAGRGLPLAQLEAFLLDRGHDPQARRLAYDLIARANPAKAAQLVPGLLDDPSNALRREAVQNLLDEAAAYRAAPNPGGAKACYETALSAARDVDQLEAVAKALRDLGETVDLAGVFGWVTRWRVIGPFDNTGLRGFEQVFPPETELRADAEYEGKAGKVRWRDLVVTDEYGKVDLNRPLGAAKEVAGYALAEFVSERAQPAEIRLGCKNAWKVWFNGELLFGRDEYHRGIEIDQYRLPVALRAGPNMILVKVCQNELVEDWTVEWEFQLRLTDPRGAPIRSAPASAPSASASADVEGRVK